jgi:hypothetical protein
LSAEGKTVMATVDNGRTDAQIDALMFVKGADDASVAAVLGL